MNLLIHHGVKGQKWGVRRYQNYDGTLTAAGKEWRYHVNRMKRNIKTSSDVNDIVDTLTDKEKRLLGTSVNEKYVEDVIKQNEALIRRTILKVKDVPVSAFEIYDDGEVAIVTRNDPQYRNKGYAKRVARRALNLYERYDKEIVPELRWILHKGNIKSQKVAESVGFKKSKKPFYNNEDYKYYSYRSKRR